jgi:hypothetical protein
MTAQLSDDLPEELRGLGEVLEIYRTGIALSVYAGCAFLFMGCCFLTPWFVAAQGGNFLSGLKWGIGGIVSLIWGARMLRNSWRKPRLHVFVFPQAMACVEKGQVEIIRWEDVNRFWRVDGSNSHPPRSIGEGVYQVILDRRDGRRFVFNESLSRFRSFSRLVKEQTLRHMLPPALQAFDSGATIGFGDVSVNAEGIHCGQDTLPWDLFDRAEIAKRRLILYSRNTKKLFGQMDLYQVPNFHVLLALAERARARHHD